MFIGVLDIENINIKCGAILITQNLGDINLKNVSLQATGDIKCDASRNKVSFINISISSQDGNFSVRP